jgi:hypothetical protein
VLVRVLQCQEREGSLERICAIWSRYLNVLRSNEAVIADAPVGKGRVSWWVARTLPGARGDTSDVEYW